MYIYIYMIFPTYESYMAYPHINVYIFMYLIMISIHMNGLYHMDIISIHVFPRRREIASQLAAIRIQAGARGFLTRSQAEPPRGGWRSM